MAYMGTPIEDIWEEEEVGSAFLTHNKGTHDKKMAGIQTNNIFRNGLLLVSAVEP